VSAPVATAASTEEQVVGMMTASLFAANRLSQETRSLLFRHGHSAGRAGQYTTWFGGGEATSFIIAKGHYANAAQVTFIEPWFYPAHRYDRRGFRGIPDWALL